MFVDLAIEMKVPGSCPCLNRASQVNIIWKMQKDRGLDSYIFPPLSIEALDWDVLSHEVLRTGIARPMLVCSTHFCDRC